MITAAYNKDFTLLTALPRHCKARSDEATHRHCEEHSDEAI